MKFSIRAIFIMMTTLLGGAVAFAQSAHPNWDSEAIEVLKQMDAYTASMQQFEVTLESYTDHDIGIAAISNPSKSKITVDRSGLLHSVTDGVLRTREIFFHDNELIVFSNEHNLYTRADTPSELDEALIFALDEFEVETPALDLLLISSLEYLVSDEEFVLHVTDSSSIRGVECHHIVISGPHADLQLWVEKGNNPVPRRSLMTFKSEQGRPRHEMFLDWKAIDNLDSSIFEFEPPAGAREIGFIDAP